jgi:hypothetical protein
MSVYLTSQTHYQEQSGDRVLWVGRHRAHKLATRQVFRDLLEWYWRRIIKCLHCWFVQCAGLKCANWSDTRSARVFYPNGLNIAEGSKIWFALWLCYVYVCHMDKWWQLRTGPEDCSNKGHRNALMFPSVWILNLCRRKLHNIYIYKGNGPIRHVETCPDFFFHCKSTHNKIHCQNFSC